MPAGTMVHASGRCQRPGEESPHHDQTSWRPSPPSRNDEGSRSNPPEIYGGLRSSWDYGPLGVELRRNIRTAWWRSMVQLRDEVVGLEAALLMSPKVWEASGHVAGFSDPLIECTNCHQRFREDHLEANPDGVITCPNCGGAEFTEPKQFNLMFQTHHGPGRRRSERRLPAARDRAGPVRGLLDRAAGEPQEAAVRDRADAASRSATRSRRATSSSARASSSRWRWSSSSSPAPTTSGSSTGAKQRMAWLLDLGALEGAVAVPSARPRRVGPLRARRHRRRVRVPVRLVRARRRAQPRRLRPAAAFGGQRRGPVLLRPGEGRALPPAT